jgi:hypothetical protein
MTDEPTHRVTLSDVNYRILLDVLREGAKSGKVDPKTAEAMLLAVGQGHRALAAKGGPSSGGTHDQYGQPLEPT